MNKVHFHFPVDFIRMTFYDDYEPEKPLLVDVDVITEAGINRGADNIEWNWYFVMFSLMESQ